jgi:hypothetical protein
MIRNEALDAQKWASGFFLTEVIPDSIMDIVLLFIYGKLIT